MFSTSLRTVLLVLTIMLFWGSGRIGLVPSADASESETKNEINATPLHLKKLILERLETMRSFVEATRAAYETDTVPLEQLIAANQELLEAELELVTALELPTKRQDRVAVYRKMVENAKQLETKVKALHDAGARGGEAEKYFHAKAARLRMEIAMEREFLSATQKQPQENPS